MAPPDFREIRIAFRGHLAAQSATFAALAAAGRVEAENASVAPDASGLWARESLSVISESRVATGLLETLGLLRVYVVGPTRTGVEEIESLARDLAGVVYAGLGLLGASGQRIHVDRSERLSGRSWGSEWYASGVSISWRAYSAAGGA